MKNLLILLIIILLVGGLYLVIKDLPWGNEGNYNPRIKPSDFSNSTTINNPYFTLIPGTTFQYEAKTGGGTERNDVTILTDNKVVMGITAVVVRDQVFSKDQLTEDTYDWYAEDNSGNVWYFGESTTEYANGTASHDGSWEAGVDGARPGMVMPRNPEVGQSYYQEYYKHYAEDRADIISLHEFVNVPFGTFSDCLETKDYTSLDSSSLEYKYYCKEVGNVVLEVDEEDKERVELVNFLRTATSTSAVH